MADTVYKNSKGDYTMKFVKRISLFFIYPMTMYSLGFASNSFIQKTFYPGDLYKAQELIEKNINNEYSPEYEEEPIQETLVSADPIITADTNYIVISYDMVDKKASENEEVTPDKYIGYNREKLEEALKEYEKSPSLTDLEKGFSNIELVSFSPEKVIVRKNYEIEPKGFYLINEQNYVVVYDENFKYRYMNTGISTEDLPEEIQTEILNMKYIGSEQELYHFLESYSS